MSASPRLDPIDLAAELRSQLDVAEYKRDELEGRLRAELRSADERNAHLARQVDEVNRQVEDLRALLSGTAGDLVDSGAVHTRDRAFWSAAWATERARNAELMLKLGQVEKWHREQGEESARLQTQLATEREETAQVSRLLDASEERVRQLEAQVARLSDSIASREVD